MQIEPVSRMGEHKIRDVREETLEKFRSLVNFYRLTHYFYDKEIAGVAQMPPGQFLVLDFDGFPAEWGLRPSALAGKSLVEAIDSLKPSYLDRLMLMSLVSLFEDSLFDALRLLLVEQPSRLQAQQKELKYSDVLAAGSRDELVETMVGEELQTLKYKSVVKWYEYLTRLAGAAQAEHGVLEQLAEIKASRDVFVHNAGITDATYQRKAGARARAGVGDTLPIDVAYVDTSARLLVSEIVRVVEALAKARDGFAAATA